MRSATRLVFPGLAFLIFVALQPVTARAGGVELTIELPPGQNAKSASASNFDMKLSATGEITGRKIQFHNLLADTPYDVSVTLEDGTILQGVDMHWYNEEESKPGTGPMTADDHEGVRAIVQDIKDFYNKKDLLIVAGDHSRAVVLTRLITDKAFHAKKGDEVIWRIELWYFKNEYGGWVKIPQVNKVLRRERYASHTDYEAATSKIKWTPELGGLRVPSGKTEATVTLRAAAPEAKK